MGKVCLRCVIGRVRLPEYERCFVNVKIALDHYIRSGPLY